MDHQPIKIEEIYRIVGEKIRAAREERGVKQDALAAQVSLTRTSIANIERGRQRLLLHTLCDIAAVLGKDLRDLLPDPRAAGLAEELGKDLRKAQSEQRVSEEEQVWIRSLIESQIGGVHGRSQKTNH